MRGPLGLGFVRSWIKHYPEGSGKRLGMIERQNLHQCRVRLSLACDLELATSGVAITPGQIPRISTSNREARGIRV